MHYTPQAWCILSPQTNLQHRRVDLLVKSTRLKWRLVFSVEQTPPRIFVFRACVGYTFCPNDSNTCGARRPEAGIRSWLRATDTPPTVDTPIELIDVSSEGKTDLRGDVGSMAYLPIVTSSRGPTGGDAENPKRKRKRRTPKAPHTVKSGRMPEAKPSKATDALDELARVTRSTSRERLVLIDRSGRTLFRLDYEPGNVDAKKAADLHQESLGEVKADLPEAVAHQAFDPPWAGEEPQRLPWSHRAENFPVPVHAHGQLGQRQTTFLSTARAADGKKGGCRSYQEESESILTREKLTGEAIPFRARVWRSTSRLARTTPLPRT
ncbi:hypothetical protein HO173_004704 [Letharia columbiana]|uniref:Uncharacterized protein n=1 Tax=Letharia columbiana TaxID=112416 RepID=A0A8H6FYW2_9LECA|nr:uncharacterized protein HO173_004704 [Letharia columbiana]KAF6237236.1 hypothetical protein HO173_004704 [Letharia columbiana]